jgi:hypothetical protein
VRPCSDPSARTSSGFQAHSLFGATFGDRKAHEDVAESATESQIKNITAAAQVISNDLVVQGNTCIGHNCSSTDANVYNLKIRDELTRIVFEDTPTCCDPSRDWVLQANDFPGGLDHFFIQDWDAVRSPSPSRATRRASLWS